MINCATLLCPNCDKVVAKSLSPSEEKIHGKVWLRKGNLLYTVCKNCNAEVQLPFRVVDDVLDSGPPLYLNK